MRVRFEPLGEEIDCGPGETVLDAAFRQGYNLAHGCREGQCSACKCYLLAGDVDLEPYSSFALSDTELANGYALMCRAVPEADVTIELLHYDPDNYRLENPIGEVTATVTAVNDLAADIVSVTLAVPREFTWVPGQYVDVHAVGVTRSFSIANLPGDGSLELIVRRYPDGRLSSRLGSEIVAGTELRLTGPYGTLHLRESGRPLVMVAGGSGIGPVLALLRQLSVNGGRGSSDVRLYFAAREPFLVNELRGLGYEPTMFDRGSLASVLQVDGDAEVYMCGPPGLLDDVEAVVAASGVEASRIHADRFTTAASAGVPEVPRAVSEREFGWFAPAGRRATLYEDVTVDTQPSVHRHLTRGWPLSFEDGRGTWNDASTALRCDDWFAFRDPGEQWERTFYQRGTAVERQLDGALSSAAEQGLLEDLTPQWVQFLRTNLQIPAFVEHGLWFALATAARDCLSDSVATCVCLQAAMKQRSAQAIVLYAMDLERHLGCELAIEPARQAFMSDDAWQPTRRYLERLAATADWGEVLIAANLCFEPTVGTLLRRELGTRAAVAGGDVVTPVLARAATQEWEWARTWTVALVRFLGERNRPVIDRWVADWMPAALEAAAALAPEGAAKVRSYGERMLAEAFEAVEAVAPAAVRTAAGRPAAVARVADDDDYQHVGIVMAKSAEGDAVARFLAGRADVIEQPAFWEIRARNRLVIPYDELSEELGYQIDAYSIQHEMSTHYGRMVATDDALMLFSDPTEAMEHLLS